MSNKILIKRGSSAPTTSNLDNYEIAYDTSANKLYIRDGSDIIPFGAIVDEDNFASDDANRAPSQQSVKAYIASELAAAGAGDITSVVAGTGLSGGATSGEATLSTNDSQIVHDNLSGFVANEHINHSSVSILAGAGLTGGGTIAASRNIHVGAGTGIDVAADFISVDVSDFMANGSNNRILTATGTDAMNAESALTFDGASLALLSQTANRAIEVGLGATANINSWIDLVGDTTYTDYGARFIRTSGGANGSTQILHRGTGQIEINAQDAGNVKLKTSNTDRVVVSSAGDVTIEGGSLTLPVAEKLYFGGGAHTYISEDADDRLRFFTGGAEFMRFTVSGGSNITNIQNDTYFGDRALWAGGALNILHSTHGYISNTSGNLSIRQQSANNDIYFSTTDGISTVNALYLDGSDDGTAVFNQDIRLNTNATYIHSKDTSGNQPRMFGMNGSNTTYIGPIDSYAGGRMYYGSSSNMSGHNFFTGGTVRMKLDGYTLNLPNTGDWSYIKNDTNSGGLRFGTRDSGGTYANQIEISNAGNYVKLNENTTVTGNLAVTGTVDGRDVASDGSKLDGIESGATADQTAAQILTAIKTVDGAGSGLDADLLDGYHLSTTRNSANTVPVRDANGYLSLGWINTTSGHTTSASSDYYVNTNDGYIRKKTLANVRTEIMGVSSGASFLRSDADNNTGAYTNQTTFYSNTAIESTSGHQSGLQVLQDTAGADAFMQFHVGSDYAFYFGLDGSTNDLAVGGWSMGANKYKIWHAGNTSSFTGDIVSSERNKGLFGTYDSTKTDHIWSMGTGYRNSSTGADFGNLYGLAYKHTNNTTGGTMGGGHQMVWCVNGSPFGAIGQSGLWSATNVTVAATGRLYLDGGDEDFIMQNGNNIISTYVNGNERLRVADSYTYMPNKIYGGDGTATAPMYNFWNDSNTGMYRIGSDHLGLAVGGANKFRVGTYGAFSPSDLYIGHGGSDYAPGINFMGGSNTPGSNAYENATIGYYDNSGTGTMQYGINRGSGSHKFNIGGNTVFYVDSGGQGRFIGATDIGLVVQSNDAGSGIAIKDSNTSGDYYNGVFCSGNDLFLKANNTERLRVKSGGDIDISNNLLFGSGNIWQLDQGSWTGGSSNQANIMLTGAAGTFGFHSNTSTVDLLVDGAIRSLSDVVAYYSDIRLKHKFQPITSALEKVQSLEGFTYESNELAKELGYNEHYDKLAGKRKVGVSAQQVQKVLPEAVTLAPFDTIKNEDGTIESKSGEDYLTVKYEKLVPLLIESIKELKEEINGLKVKLGE